MAHEVREVRAHAFPPVPPIPSVASVAGALRTLEALLLGAGQRTARRNAWTSVLEDRRRARDRVEAEHVLEAVSGRTSSAT
ncbi:MULTISPECIES: hypothetical protein [unclassified Streptomyces]|uniref:SCO2195 family GlnR-regulated protein n=1 Tax=unclassified Streptomyces TaxID=2593676 RepID=UPI0033A711DB